jgi:hypothetical protein
MFETFDFSIDRRNDFESVHLLNISNFDSTKRRDSNHASWPSSPSEGGLRLFRLSTRRLRSFRSSFSMYSRTRSGRASLFGRRFVPFPQWTIGFSIMIGHTPINSAYEHLVAPHNPTFNQ